MKARIEEVFGLAIAIIIVIVIIGLIFTEGKP
jgi:hypothetical protein